MRRMLIHFFTIADYEEEEVWLRDHHKNGWKLVNMIPPCFFVFESCEPDDVIYRLDYKNAGQTEEYMQMLKDFGWEYSGKCLGWLYFRKPAGAAASKEDGELFSDNASRVDLVSRIVMTRLIPLMIIFLCCVIPNFVRAASGEYLGGFGIIFSCFFGIMFVVYVFLIIYCGMKLRKIRNRYQH